MSIGLSSDFTPPPLAASENRAPRGILRRDHGHQANGNSGQSNGDEDSQHGQEPADPSIAEAAQQDGDDLGDDEPEENSIPDEPAEPVRVLDALPTAPVAAASVVPNGWALSGAGLLHGATVVLFTALVVVRRLVGDDNAELLELAFHRNGAWEHREITRGQAATAQKLVAALARVGVPITAANGRAVMQYLSEYERDNDHAIPVVSLTQHTGWHGIGDERYFVLGDRVFAARDESAGAENQPDVVRFRAANDNAAQVAAGLNTAGTMAGWLSAVAPIGAYPHAQFALFSALVPPLLEILGVSNFVVDFSGPTSRGKTTVLRIAASIWGNPDQTDANSSMISWDSTYAYRLAIAAAMVDLPLIIDEMRLANSPEEIVQFVYAIVSGRTRGRAGGNGSPSGLSLVLITSGEVPIVSLTRKGGARARVFSLWGSPFGGTTADTAVVVRRLSDGLAASYGHAGAAFVQFLLDRQGFWEMWREDYRQRVASLEQRSAGYPVVSRMASALAAISLAATIAHEALELPWPHQDVVGLLWDELIEQAPDADSATAALEHAIDWARGRRNQFYREGQSRSRTWAGRWDDGVAWIGFRPETLRQVLTAGGFECDAVLRSWRDRGWLLVDPGSNKAMHRARIGQENCWLIAIRMEAIRQVEGAEADENA